jgi:hypothetical protein
MLDRCAAINAELLAVAEGMRRRIAAIPDDDLAGEDGTPAVASPKEP